MRAGFILTKKEAADIFLILSTARIKLNGKVKTSANKYFQKFEEGLGLKLNSEEEKHGI